MIQQATNYSNGFCKIKADLRQVANALCNKGMYTIEGISMKPTVYMTGEGEITAYQKDGMITMTPEEAVSFAKELIEIAKDYVDRMPMRRELENYDTITGRYRGKSSRVNLDAFIEMYNSGIRYHEMGQMLNVSDATIGNIAKKLVTEGRIKARRKG